MRRIWGFQRAARGRMVDRRGEVFPMRFQGTQEREPTALTFIPKADRKRLLELYFEDPQKNTPENLAAASGCPLPNVRGMIKLAHMQRALEKTFRKRYYWNFEKVETSVAKSEPAGAVGGDDPPSDSANRGGDEDPEAIEADPATKMEATEEREEVVLGQSSDGSKFVKKELSPTEKAILGKVAEFPPELQACARKWYNELLEPNAVKKKISQEMNDSGIHMFGSFDSLQGETEAGAVRDVAPWLYKRLLRHAESTHMEKSAEKTLKMMFDDQYLLEGKAPRNVPPSYIFLDIGPHKKPSERKAWVYNVKERTTREATDDERDRMIMSRYNVPEPKSL